MREAERFGHALAAGRFWAPYAAHMQHMNKVDYSISESMRFDEHHRNSYNTLNKIKNDAERFVS